MTDSIQPAHYHADNPDQTPIAVIEAWNLGFCLGNTVKYIARAGKKGDRLEDLKKARWYLDREIERDNELATCTILDHPEDPHFCKGTDGYTYDPSPPTKEEPFVCVTHTDCKWSGRVYQENIAGKVVVDETHECGPAC